MSITRLVLLIAIGLVLSQSATATVAATTAEPLTTTWACPAQEEAFPSSTALAEGLSPASLETLRELVQSFVKDGEVVGAELLVIKNGRSVLHEGFGLKDAEAELAMETGNVFCVRSMTKPLIGTSILMLAADRQLALDDPLSKYLPAFGAGNKQDITIAQLLTHTSGLPMSLLLGKDLGELDGIQAVAQLGAEIELEFEPGSAFQYSDQGTDTLTAVIEIVSGMPAAEFVRTRILDPLGMQDSTCVMTEESPLRGLACSKYAGSRGNWSRFWSPADAPLFPFFLGSQGLYSTPVDYARFMDFWLRKGRARDGRLLRASSIRKALLPSLFPFPGSTGMSGTDPGYASLMQVWMEADEEADSDTAKRPKLVAFGHGGSDGTHAWVFPKQKAIVLYFTQSRGNTTGLRVEELLAELFLGVPFDANQVAPPFDEYLGYYAEDEHSRYQAVIRDGEDLALETPGKRIRKLIYIGEDRWKLRAKPSVVLAFDRSTDGVITGFHLGDHEEFRFEPSGALPAVDEVVARVAATHRLDLLEELGPLRLHSTLRIEKLDITGDVTTLWSWPNKFRVDAHVKERVERLAYDGTGCWAATAPDAPAVLEGPRANELRSQNPLALFGDWHAWYPTLRVIQRIQKGERDILILRAGDTTATAMTLYVDWATGRLEHVDSMNFIEGMGRTGHSTSFDDFRDVSGMLLPFRSSVRLSNEMIGTIVTTVDSHELGVVLADGVFQLRD